MHKVTGGELEGGGGVLLCMLPFSLKKKRRDKHLCFL